MQILNILLLFGFIVLSIENVQSDEDSKFDYCTLEDENCKNHIGCANTKVIKIWDVVTPANIIIPLTPESKNDIVMMYNTFYNYVASGHTILGNISNFESVIWDNDLEEMAKILAEKLTFFQIGQNTYCSNTKKHTFTHAEVNGGHFATAEAVIQKGLNDFSELVSEEGESPLEDLTGDNRVWTHVGCQFVIFHNYDESDKDHKVTDNWENFGSIICVAEKNKVYKDKSYWIEGKPCSNCLGECDATYPALCKTQDD